MPAYPLYVQDSESRRTLSGNVQSERAADGSLRARILGPDTAEFEIVHVLTPAEVQALKAWRTANLGVPVDFVWQGDGAAYSVICTQPINVRELGPLTHLATVLLSGI